MRARITPSTHLFDGAPLLLTIVSRAPDSIYIWLKLTWKYAWKLNGYAHAFVFMEYFQKIHELQVRKKVNKALFLDA